MDNKENEKIFRRKEETRTFRNLRYCGTKNIFFKLLYLFKLTSGKSFQLILFANSV
mgnify:CR=1 FL=1